MARGERNHVWVERNPESGLPIRIIKPREAYNARDIEIAFVDKTWAIGEIRRQVFERDNYECRRCGKRLNLQNGHMDHIISKGEGGETSVANGWLLCFDCHEGNKATSEHGNRRIRFGESNV